MVDLDPVNTVKTSDGNILAAITGGMAGVFTVIFAGVGTVWEAIFSFLVDPLLALTNELVALVSAYIPSEIVQSGVDISANALNQFGFLAYPMGMIIVAMGLFVLAQLLNAEFTSDLIPFSLTDFPLIGTDEEEE